MVRPYGALWSRVRVLKEAFGASVSEKSRHVRGLYRVNVTLSPGNIPSATTVCFEAAACEVQAGRVDCPD